MNKKICFISLGNLYLCPYISKYITKIDCDYDIIYWNRHEIQENTDARYNFSFDYPMNEGTGKFKKLIGYFKFRSYVLKILNKYNYDGIILLQTSIGILLNSFLEKFFKGKYIVDIRDYTMENNKIFLAIEKRLVKNSAFTVISSKGYENFLPQHDYVLVHNDVMIDEKTIERFKNKKSNNKIVISYIGLIRFHEQNKKVILKFKNDERFLLKFIGKDAMSLDTFCKDNDIKNVELIDRFPPEQTLDYYYETDIIYNIYGNNTPLLDYALSNKLYYAAKLKIPILVCPHTYMEEISVEAGFGIVFDINNVKALDNLYNAYNSIDWEILKDKSDIFLKKVEEDNNYFEASIKEFQYSLFRR